MRIAFKLGKYLITLSRAYQPLTHFAKHTYNDGATIHFVIGKLSLCIDDTIAEVYRLCAECDSPEISEVRCGDNDSLTVCQSCRSVEQGYRYVNLETFENAS